MSDSDEVVFKQDQYKVVVKSPLGRYHLMYDMQELAWCWFESKHGRDFPKWIISYEKNARKQIDSLQRRINNLKEQQDNFKMILGSGITTVNGKDPKELTKEEALEYCYANAEKFIENDGREQFDGLIVILEGDTIEPHQITDYGMSDQDLELT